MISKYQHDSRILTPHCEQHKPAAHGVKGPHSFVTAGQFDAVVGFVVGLAVATVGLVDGLAVAIAVVVIVVVVVVVVVATTVKVVVVTGGFTSIVGWDDGIGAPPTPWRRAIVDGE